MTAAEFEAWVAGRVLDSTVEIDGRRVVGSLNAKAIAQLAWRLAEDECARLRSEMTACSAQLRHVYRAAFLAGREVSAHDDGLLSHVIRRLEAATEVKP